MSTPIIHFAQRSDAAEHVEMGPALCRAGRRHRTEKEQYVAGDWSYVTCKSCHRLLRAHNRREAAEEAQGMDFDEIAERQGWNDQSLIHLLRTFITLQGLGDELDKFARSQADEENATALTPPEAYDDAKGGV